MFVVRRAEGFSLLETLVAVSVFAVGISALAQLIVLATHLNQRSKAVTLATLLAQEKIEQLRALAWGVDVLGLAVTDLSSDTAVVPEAGSGGTGLGPSPENSLAVNADGYCDFADASGRLLSGAGPALAVPAGAAFIRRWSVKALSASTLLIQVHVLGRAPSSGVLARLATVRARRAVP